MKVLSRVLSVFALAALFTGVVIADEKKPDVKKPDAKKPDEKKPDEKKPDVKKPAPPAGPFAFPETIKLSGDQQAKLDALKAEYAPKVAELAKKTSAIFTPERLKLQAETRKKLAGEGKKGPELEKAVIEAMKYTGEELAQIKEINASRQKLNQEIRTKMMEVLTEEQRKQLQPKPPVKDKKPEPAKKTEK